MTGKSEGSYLWTVFCKLPEDGRGQYSEEIDIWTDWKYGVTKILRIAQSMIDQGDLYDKRLRAVRAVLVFY